MDRLTLALTVAFTLIVTVCPTVLGLPFVPLRGASWMSAALVHVGIEVKVVMLPDDVRQAVRRAQEREFR